jgi:hypothetical protein
VARALWIEFFQRRYGSMSGQKNNPLASFTSGTAYVSANGAVTRPAQGIK